MAAEFARWDDIDVHFRGEVVTSGGHGFAAMSRRRLLAILRDRCRALGVALRFDRGRAAGRPTLRAEFDLVVACRRRQLHGPGRGRRPPSAPTLEHAALPLHLARHRQGLRRVHLRRRGTPTGVMQVHAYPYDATGVDAHRGDARRGLAASRLRRLAGGHSRTLAPATPTPRRSPRCEKIFADLLGRRTGRSLTATTRRWITFTTVRCERWSRRQRRCCSATPRTPRTSPSAPARSSPWRTRSRWPPACPRQPDAARGARRLRGRAPARRGVHPARRAGQPGVVREPRPVRRPATRCSSRSTCSPAAAGSPTTTCGCATRSSSPRWTSGSRASLGEPVHARRCSTRSGCAA